jgi:short-subunit dehydrogenase
VVELRGRVCVVTGASSGIGRRTALDLAARGAVICGVARRAERLETLLAELPGEGHSSVVTDVTKKGQVRAMGAHVREAYGRCDILINSAGISGAGTFDATDAVRRTEEVMRTNFFGALYCTAELLPLLEASAPSNVVNIASVAGRLALRGSSAYAASKFALVGWSEALHFELAERGVCVSLIEPGPLPTEGFPMTRLVNDPLVRHVLTSEGQVSSAIQRSISHRKLQRVVPRWYYLLPIARLIAPPVYRFAQGPLAAVRNRRTDGDG